MALETGLFARGLTLLMSLFRGLRRRNYAKRWTGNWEAYTLRGRHLSEPMRGAGPATVSLGRWTLSGKLQFACYECDAQGTPTRYQAGHIMLDPNDPEAATRIGRYLDSAEVYEQRVRMLDKDTLLIIPVPERSTLGNVYATHGWRRKR